MNLVNPRTFNPEIIYLFDPWTQSESHGEMHHHDFLEISVLLEGESTYYFEKRTSEKNPCWQRHAFQSWRRSLRIAA